MWKGGPPYTSTRHAYAKSRRYRYKAKAVEYLGGKCSICGYARCLAALDFHHLDPLKKKFELKHLAGIRWEILEEEINKCVLLCANCHRELHWKENNES